MGLPRMGTLRALEALMVALSSPALVLVSVL
jgi:hypothetical protein